MAKDTVQITLDVPKGVISFLDDLFKMGASEWTPKTYLENEAAQSVDAILGSLPDMWFDRDAVLKRYGLDKK